MVIRLIAVLLLALCIFPELYAQSNTADNSLVATVSRADKQWGQYMRITLRYRGEQSLQDIDLGSWRELAAITVEDEYRDVDELERDIQVMVLRLYPRSVGTHSLPALTIGKARGNPLTLVSTEPVVEESILGLEWQVSKTRAWQREAIVIRVQLTTTDYSAHLKLGPVEQQRYISKALNTKTDRLPDGQYRHQAGWVIYPLESGTLDLDLPPIRYQLSGSDRRRFHLPIQNLTINPLPSYLPPILPVGKLDISSQVRWQDKTPEWHIDVASNGLIPYGIPGIDSQLARVSKHDIADIRFQSVQYEDYSKHGNQAYYKAPLPTWLMPYGKGISIKLRYFNPDSGTLEEKLHTLPRQLRMPDWAWGLVITIVLVLVIIGFPYIHRYLGAYVHRINLGRSIKKAKSVEEIRGAILSGNRYITLSQWAFQQPQRKKIASEIDLHCFSLEKHRESLDILKSKLIALV